MNRIYVASRVKHASLWQAARGDGYNIISTWIDEAGPGQTESLSELWQRITSEVLSADAFVIFRDGPEEILKGAYVELGLALATGIPIYAVGFDVEPIPSFIQHPRVRRHFQSIGAALEAVEMDEPRGDRVPDPQTKRALYTMVMDRTAASSSIVCIPKQRMLQLLSLIPIKAQHKMEEVPIFQRAGNAVCSDCGLTYYQHPQHEYIDETWHNLALYLHKLCNGTYVKL